jgi:putative transposase
VAAIKDLFAGEVVGRACGAGMRTDPVVRAFVQAVSARRPAPGLIHRTESRVAVLQPRLPGGVARQRGEGLDEPQGGLLRQRSQRELSGTLKTELVHHRRYQRCAEAEREIGEYIDLFYNRQRRPARLGYLSPVAYTQLFTRQQRAA